MKERTLSSGVRIPALIMGTYPLRDEAMDAAAEAALRVGYQGFDTARNYENEASLGHALSLALPKCGLRREDVFIETKIGETLEHGIPDGNDLTRHEGEEKNIPAFVARCIAESCEKLRTDYLDLLMIHWPHPDFFVEVWRELEKAYRKGVVRSIGVSNCREWHLRKLLESGVGTMPMVNQIEHHPFNAQRGIAEICREMGIQVEAYSPLIRITRHGAAPAALEEIARRHGKSVSQVVLRWNIQQGIVPLPKSGNPERLLENISVFDFELDADEMMRIDLLNKDQVYLNPETYCPGFSRFK